MKIWNCSGKKNLNAWFTPNQQLTSTMNSPTASTDSTSAAATTMEKKKIRVQKVRAQKVRVAKLAPVIAPMVSPLGVPLSINSPHQSVSISAISMEEIRADAPEMGKHRAPPQVDEDTHSPDISRVKAADAPSISEELNEGFCAEALDILIAHSEELRVTPVECSQLIRYRDSIEYGLIGGIATRKVTYRPAAHALGRLYADSGLSLQSFPRRIRHTLCSLLCAGEMIYHDVDMANAHPRLLLQLCEANGWECIELNRYVSRREELLQDVMAQYNVNRDDAKTLFLRLLYGGKFQNWAHDSIIDTTLTVHPPATAQILAFEEELASIRERVWNDDQYARFRSAALANRESGTGNVQSRCLSLVLQDMEHKLLMAMREFFTKRGWNVGVYVFDGLMLYCRKGVGRRRFGIWG
jgi:hypothetical protein